tara:strand:- start:1212 stop:1505 length:294 start_codon:yes stop_codon:yes gene_type:complete
MPKPLQNMKFLRVKNLFGEEHTEMLETGPLRNLKRGEQTIPEVGDLIVERARPNRAVAIVLEVGDRRKTEDVYRVCGPSGQVWLSKRYVEYRCRLLS